MKNLPQRLGPRLGPFLEEPRLKRQGRAVRLRQRGGKARLSAETPPEITYRIAKTEVGCPRAARPQIQIHQIPVKKAALASGLGQNPKMKSKARAEHPRMARIPRCH